MGFSRAPHGRSVVYYLHLEKMTEASLLPSEKAAGERRAYGRRQAMLYFEVAVHQAVGGASQGILEDYRSEG